MRAFIITDIQNDFVAGGSLEVPGGEQVIPLINQLSERFDLVVATQDWHPPSHMSFASNHSGKNIFDTIMLGGLEQVLWPDHCVQGSRGAAFRDDLHMNRVEAIFRKGMDPEIDSYSAFYDNGYKKNTGLAGFLKDRAVTQVYLCGLAGDYCVFYSAKDALKAEFETFIIEDATRPISKDGFEKAKKEIRRLGGKIIQSDKIL
ncbi:MAG TPA: bifunctional nicotinamidase/pyrazinamidase [Chryseosolibacter sp.]|nr:bifunctional nicotinamidase/pyrazinamidase [Chryseosolibacter sp.]